MVRVLGGGDKSDPFPVCTGVRQGCVIAPVIFNLFLAAVMLAAKKNINPEDCINLTYRLDGSLFNLRRLKAPARVKHETILELQYADDAAIVGRSAAGLQRNLDTLDTAYTRAGLGINTGKKEVMFQGQGSSFPCIQIKGTQLKNVRSFTYLGSVLTSPSDATDDVQRRIGLASASFGRLSSRVFLNKDLTTQTKVAVYKAVCLPGLSTDDTYGLLSVFTSDAYKEFSDSKWWHKVPHVEIRRRANVDPMETILLQRQLRCTGHLTRLPPNRLPRQVLYGELTHGRRVVGGQYKRFKDCLKHNLKKCDIPTQDLEHCAADRSGWRNACMAGSQLYTRRLNELSEARRAKRHLRRERGGRTSSAPDDRPECRVVVVRPAFTTLDSVSTGKPRREARTGAPGENAGFSRASRRLGKMTSQVPRLPTGIQDVAGQQRVRPPAPQQGVRHQAPAPPGVQQQAPPLGVQQQAPPPAAGQQQAPPPGVQQQAPPPGVQQQALAPGPQQMGGGQPGAGGSQSASQPIMTSLQMGAGTSPSIKEFELRHPFDSLEAYRKYLELAELRTQMKEMADKLDRTKRGRTAEEVREELVQYAGRPAAAFEPQRSVALIYTLVSQARKEDHPKTQEFGKARALGGPMRGYPSRSTSSTAEHRTSTQDKAVEGAGRTAGAPSQGTDVRFPVDPLGAYKEHLLARKTWITRQRDGRTIVPPSIQDVASGKIKASADSLMFRDPDNFIAEGVHRHPEEWRKILDSGFHNAEVERWIENGERSPYGVREEVDPPYIVMALTVEPKNPRLFHDLQYLNKWMKDCPFQVDSILHLTKYMECNHFQTKCDDKSG
ncbi:hypothetical protein Bbelb_343870 [Branchiostoma belcheri]|nr:hypothetical protein Bbelb_343870 [Branchiostoma belcheri]